MKKRIGTAELGEACAVARVLYRILIQSEAKPLDQIADRQNLQSGSDVIYLASAVSSQLDKLYATAVENEDA